MRDILWIAIGGGTGAVLRYWVQEWTQLLVPSSFPLGTLVVNVLGCLLIGFFAALFTGPMLARPELRFAIVVGLLGGFTTFSTYGWETFALLEAGRSGLALLYLAVSNALGIAGVWLGYRAAQLTWGL